MVKSILPGSVNKALNIKVLDELIATRLGNLDTSIVVLAMIDSAPVAALPYLAEEYGILGYRGWKFADTETKQRDMLKQAFVLHKYRGTPWAIKNALQMVGIIGGVTIKENIVITYDGTWSYNGFVYYGRHYAYFRVIIEIANLNNIPVEDIKGIINEYKRETQWLFNVGFQVSHNDAITVTDTSDYSVGVDGSDRLGFTENLRVVTFHV